MKKTEASSFAPSKIANVQSIYLTQDTVSITTDDWYYTFKIIYVSADRVILTFLDDAKLATYFTTVDYNLEWQEKTKNWFIISRVVKYISGSFEDKLIEGKLFRFNKPIPFLEKN
jgi:hypothetical protein